MLCSVNNVFDSTVLQTHNILLFCVVLLLDVKKEKKESVPEMYEGFLFIYFLCACDLGCQKHNLSYFHLNAIIQI